MVKSRPLATSEILREEYGVLRPNAADGQPKAPLAALCLSGGGIRSATFALGVIQGLAGQGALNAFDYLSTVSGGGYIGAWLTCWKQRAQGIDKVIPQLLPDAPAVPEGQPDPIEHLREYNNYLAPRSGLFSADVWTMAATMVRNMFLNWLVFVPLLLAALTAPRLILSLARLGETFTSFYGPSPWVSTDLLAKLIPAASAFFLAAATFNILRYLPGVGGKNHSETDFLKYCLLPLVLAALAFMTNDAWFTGGDLTRAGIDYPEEIGYWTLTLSVVAAGFTGWLAYLIFGGKTRQEYVHLFLPVSAAVVLTCWTAGSAAWLFVDKVYPRTSWPVYTTVAAPLLIASLLIAGFFFVGFTSRALRDSDREWLSRAGGWMLMVIAAWTGACALVLILPGWAFALPGMGQSAIAAAGAIAGWTSALGGFSPQTKPGYGSDARGENAGAPPASLLITIASKLAAPVFAGAVLLGLAILTNWILKMSHLGALSKWNAATQSWAITHCPNCNWWEHEALLEGTRWEANLALGLAFLGFAWIMARFININTFSLQAMYRSRLVRAYLGASNAHRNANDFTGFAQNDNMQLHELDTSLNPLHVVNATLNLVASRQLAWQQRMAEPFTMTPLHCGSAHLGYRPSRQYGGPDGISFGTAIATSGAAASPAMGYNSSEPIAFIMMLFNARLGCWLGNPGSAGAKTWLQGGPTSAIASIVREAFGLTDDTSSYVYLSDGGHFENLAIYEMVRRRCRYIVVSDAGEDLNFTFEDLGNALRKIRIDFKVPIKFEDGSFEAVEKKNKRCAIARICYSMVDESQEDGYLIYIKPMMRGNEPPDVISYQKDHPTFPHESTADQFFNESQTESYRMLGLQSVNEISAGWDKAGGIPGLFEWVARNYVGDSQHLAAARGVGQAASS